MLISADFSSWGNCEGKYRRFNDFLKKKKKKIIYQIKLRDLRRWSADLNC